MMKKILFISGFVISVAAMGTVFAGDFSQNRAKLQEDMLKLRQDRQTMMQDQAQMQKDREALRRGQMENKMNGQMGGMNRPNTNAAPAY